MQRCKQLCDAVAVQMRRCCYDRMAQAVQKLECLEHQGAVDIAERMCGHQYIMPITVNIRINLTPGYSHYFSYPNLTSSTSTSYQGFSYQLHT
jgi:hypothetical protein